MGRIALICFIENSIITQPLRSYLKTKGYDCILLYCKALPSKKNSSELVKILTEMEIDLVGISVLTDNYYSAVAVTKLIKNSTDIPVIWGGAHVNIMPEECLQYADMICMGEGEEAVADLAANIADGKWTDASIKNIWYKTQNGIIQNQIRNLETNIDKYYATGINEGIHYIINEDGVRILKDNLARKEYSIITSRGCPYSCSYCYNNYRRKQYAGKGSYVRLRSIENIIKELTQAKKLYSKLELIRFWDDNFISRSFSDIKRFSELYLANINLPFYAMADPRSFEREKIEILRKTGLVELQIGIQSGSERLNKNCYFRFISNKKITEMALMMDQMKIRGKYDLIFNNPYETTEDIVQTIKLLLTLPNPSYIQGLNLIFYPKADITVNALQDGYISPKSKGDDFSLTSGYYNWPLSVKCRDVFSTRYYDINFNPRGKKYFNQIICLFTFRFMAKPLIKCLVKYFAASDAAYKRIILNGIINFYIRCTQIRDFFISVFRARKALSRPT